MDTMMMFGDPVNVLAIWTAFLLWLLFTLLVQRLRMPHSVLLTATLSWIVARLVLTILPAIIHHMEVWFGT